MPGHEVHDLTLAILKVVLFSPQDSVQGSWENLRENLLRTNLQSACR